MDTAQFFNSFFSERGSAVPRQVFAAASEAGIDLDALQDDFLRLGGRIERNGPIVEWVWRNNYGGLSTNRNSPASLPTNDNPRAVIEWLRSQRKAR